jgi:hypothetical protein
MNFTLFGYPKTGKTTLFNLLTGARIEVKAYEEGKKGEPNLRTCPLPDPRLDELAGFYPEKKKISLHIDYLDLSGISFGEVKNSLYLSHLRKADSLIHVVRGFLDGQIPYPKKVGPKDDIAIMEDELILADLVMVETRLEKLGKDLKKVKDPDAEKEYDLLGRLRPTLAEGKSLRGIALSGAEEKLLRSFAFLSLKPLLHMINIDEKDISALDAPENLFGLSVGGREVMAFCGKIELEISELAEDEERTFLAEYGIKELSAARFLRAAPRLLETISFFTIGKDEVKAWAIKKNSTALKAAGAIHTDIEKGFIRAEVLSWEEFRRHGSHHAAKEKGSIRLEGKDYIVQDGDIIYFRFAQ